MRAVGDAFLTAFETKAEANPPTASCAIDGLKKAPGRPLPSCEIRAGHTLPGEGRRAYRRLVDRARLSGTRSFAMGVALLLYVEPVEPVTVWLAQEGQATAGESAAWPPREVVASYWRMSTRTSFSVGPLTAFSTTSPIPRT
jgi:hypothetical protein